MEHRDNVAREILSSERSYVKNLNIIFQVFLDPLRKALASSKPILKQEDIKKYLFGY